MLPLEFSSVSDMDKELASMRRYAAFLGACRRRAPARDWSVGAAPAGLCAFLPIELRRSAGIIRQPCLSSRQCQPQAFGR